MITRLRVAAVAALVLAIPACAALPEAAGGDTKSALVATPIAMPAPAPVVHGSTETGWGDICESIGRLAAIANRSRAAGIPLEKTIAAIRTSRLSGPAALEAGESVVRLAYVLPTPEAAQAAALRVCDRAGR